MSHRSTRQDLLAQRIDKLEIALLLLLNLLRDSRKTGDIDVLPALPGKTLDSIERMILTKIPEE